MAITTKVLTVTKWIEKNLGWIAAISLILLIGIVWYAISIRKYELAIGIAGIVGTLLGPIIYKQLDIEKHKEILTAEKKHATYQEFISKLMEFQRSLLNFKNIVDETKILSDGDAIKKYRDRFFKSHTEYAACTKQLSEAYFANVLYFSKQVKDIFYDLWDDSVMSLQKKFSEKEFDVEFSDEDKLVIQQKIAKMLTNSANIIYCAQKELGIEDTDYIKLK